MWPSHAMNPRLFNQDETPASTTAGGGPFFGSRVVDAPLHDLVNWRACFNCLSRFTMPNPRKTQREPLRSRAA